MSAVACFEIGDVGVGGVGHEDLVPPAVGVKEVELGPGVGFFASDDGPGALGPVREIHEAGDLGDFGALSNLTARGDGLGPVPLPKSQDGQAHRHAHLRADGELDPPLDQGVDEGTAGSRGVGSHQHGHAAHRVHAFGRHGQLVQREVQDRNVVVRVVG
jgi:hypothetical protein